MRYDDRRECQRVLPRFSGQIASHEFGRDSAAAEPAAFNPVLGADQTVVLTVSGVPPPADLNRVFWDVRGEGLIFKLFPDFSVLGDHVGPTYQ